MSVATVPPTHQPVSTLPSSAVAPATRPEAPPPHNQRLVSLDALRGFDMFWLIGAGHIATGLKGLHDAPWTHTLTTQLQHVKWEGFHFYDLIFPLFLFIVGASLVLSLDKALARQGRVAVLRRIVVRSLLLYGLGVLYYGGLSQRWPNIQLGGVLQRIALCYFAAACIYLVVRTPRGLFAVSAALLLGYWALLAWVPFPDLKLTEEGVNAVAARAGSTAPADIAAVVPERIHSVYEEGRNLTNYIDFLYLPGKKPQKYYINEGLLSTLPSIALPLFGAIAVLLLRRTDLSSRQKVLWLLAAGGTGIALGLLWSLEFPLIKRIWTSSFVLLSAGLSACLLAVFYLLIDVLQWRRWCQPFVWIGANALTLYLAVKVVNFREVAELFVGGDVQRSLDVHWQGAGAGRMLTSFVALLLVLLLARFLYRRNIFLRV